MSKKSHLILFIICSVLIISVFTFCFFRQDADKSKENFSTLNEISGLVAHTHPMYSDFGVRDSGFSVDGRIGNRTRVVSVNDNLVYKLGYYSINGTDWKGFNLSGTSFESDNRWLVGSTSHDLPDFGAGEHYVIVYSCSSVNSSWDCHGNKWQLIVINNSYADNTSNTGVNNSINNVNTNNGSVSNSSVNTSVNTSVSSSVNASANTNTGVASGPVISFISPTPSNRASNLSSSQRITASITDSSDVDTSAWIDFDKSLVGYWAMNYHNNLRIYDNSTYNHFGLFSGGLDSSRIINGIRGEALSFDGEGDCLNVSGTNDVSLPSLTVSAWVYANEEGHDSDAWEADGIITKYSTDMYGWKLGINSNGYASWAYIYWPCTADAISGSTNLVGGWHLLTATRNSSSMSLYVDGALVQSKSVSCASTNNELASITLGYRREGNADAEEDFNGLIDEAMIFSRVLSSSEILSLYNADARGIDALFNGLTSGTHNYSVYAINSEGILSISNSRSFSVTSSSITPSCTAETNTVFCSRLSKECGSVTATDNCGNSRTVSSCGSCSSTETCTSNVCVTTSSSSVVCGDGTCSSTEDCSSCSDDCGSCQSSSSQSYSGTVYYVSNSGSDSNSGTSESAPWQTLAKVNAQTFSAGDAVLFKRGGTWSGELIVRASGSSGNPITYGAYGSGNKPILTGFTTVTGWTNEGNGIYSRAVSSESTPNILSINGANTPIGRWPNSGWLTIDSASGSSSITDNDLSSKTPADWDGGEVVIRKHWWIIDRNIITSHSGNTIYYTSASEYSGHSGNGYFIQNHKGTLDTTGDWSYDGSKLYVYFGSNSPSDYVVKFPSVDNFSYLNNKDYILFDNLHITGYNDVAVLIYSSSHITVTNCVIDFIGDKAVFSPWQSGSDYPVVEYNMIDNINNVGVGFRGDTQHASIQHNTVSNIGAISGLAGSADACGIGIDAIADNTVISYNNITNIGYNGITFGGANSVVSYNVVNTFCMNKDDGAGIYTYEDSDTGKQIVNNIVINGVGAPEGTYAPDEFRAHGIYIDGSDNILISGNSLAYNYGAGMFINTQALNMNIRNNNVYDSKEAGIQILSDITNGGGVVYGMTLLNNMFVAVGTQEALYYATANGDSELGELGSASTINNNYYARPTDDDNVMRTQTYAWSGSSIYRTLAGWQSYSGYDADSHASPKSVSSTSDIRFEYNPTTSSKVVSLSGSYVDIKGQAYSGSVTLAPYSSIILLKN